jgi:hypothetical protein
LDFIITDSSGSKALPRQVFALILWKHTRTRKPMKSFLAAIAVALVLAVGASVVLEQSQKTAEAKFSSSSVRN